MAKIKILTDRQGEKFYPVTTSQAVKDSEGNVLDDKLNTLELKVDSAVTLEVLDTTLENYSTTESVLQRIDDSLLREFAEEWNKYGSCTLGNTPIFVDNTGSNAYTLKEAQLILKEGAFDIPNYHKIKGSKIKGTIVTKMKIYDSNDSSDSVGVNLSHLVYNCPNLEVLNIHRGNGNTTGNYIYPSSVDRLVDTCPKLTTILGNLCLRDVKCADTIFIGTPELQYVDIRLVSCDLDLSECPKLQYSVFENIYSKRNTKLSNPIHIFVHPDIYAKFIGDTTNEEAAKLSEAELEKYQNLLKNLTFNKIYISLK